MRFSGDLRKSVRDACESSFFRIAASSFAIKIVAAGTAFGLQIILARSLGAKDYGDYVYVLTWILLLMSLSSLGMDGAALRFVASYAGQEAWGELRGFVLRGIQWVLFASIVISILSLAGILLFRDAIRPELIGIFFIGFFLLPINSLLTFGGACLQALKHVVVAEALQTVLRSLLFGLLFIFLYLVSPQSLVAENAMILQLVAAFIMLVILFYQLFRKSPKAVKNVSPVFHNRYWLSTSLPFLALSGLSLLLTRTDIIMIGFFQGTQDAGIYAIATRIIILSSFGIAAVNSILAPMIAQYYARKEFKELQKVVTHAAVGNAVVTVPIVIVLIIFGKSVLALFGSAFMVAYLPLSILLLGQLVDALAGSVGYLMTMTGHQNEVLKVVGFCSILNVILNAVLIPVMGLTGAALSTAITVALLNIILVFRVNNRIQINSTIFRWNKS